MSDISGNHKQITLLMFKYTLRNLDYKRKKYTQEIWEEE